MQTYMAHTFKMVAMEVSQFEAWKKKYPKAVILDIKYSTAPAAYVPGFPVQSPHDRVLIIGQWPDKGEVS